jgi:glucose-1-phosphate cytidylyltransferase
LGYKAQSIKEYFLNYYLYNSDININLKTNELEVLNSDSENFKVTLVDTGLNTNTAGRLKKIQPYVDNQTFMLTYGDGVADIDINALLEFHRLNGKLATLSSIQTPGRFGNIEMDEGGIIHNFTEKPAGDGLWINGGFFVLEPGIFNYLNGDMDDVQWEKGPLNKIAQNEQLVAYKHFGFWKCMDALRDRIELEGLWSSGNAKWKIW